MRRIAHQNFCQFENDEERRHEKSLKLIIYEGCIFCNFTTKRFKCGNETTRICPLDVNHEFNLKI